MPQCEPSEMDGMERRALASSIERSQRTGGSETIFCFLEMGVPRESLSFSGS